MGRLKILIIEDEIKMRQIMKEALETEYQVSVASDGKDGLHQAGLVMPDLVLLDLRMPGMDGLEVLAKLKTTQRTRSIPVVIVSAKGETESLFFGQRAGAADYLIKPLQLNDLYAVIRRQLAIHGV